MLADGDDDAIMIATGSEVAVALAARDELAKQRRRGARRVDAVLGAVRGSRTRRIASRCCRRRSTARVSIEAGVTFGWREYIGDRGVAIGIDRYGASAPGEVVLEKLGINARRRSSRPCCAPAGSYLRHAPSASGVHVVALWGLRPYSMCAATARCPLRSSWKPHASVP